MSTHNIGFYEDLTKLSLNYHQILSNTHLISSAADHVACVANGKFYDTGVYPMRDSGITKKKTKKKHKKTQTTTKNSNKTTNNTYS